MKIRNLLICTAAAVCMVSAAANAADIGIGEYVQLGEFYQEPVLWRCVSQDENGMLMLSDGILTMRAFDGAGEHDNDIMNFRLYYGSNRWENSNLRDWLNSDAEAGKVVWSCGNAPSKENVWNGYNAYDDEAGFLNGFTDSQKSAVKEVTQKQLLSWRDALTANMAKDGSELHISYSATVPNSVKNYDIAYSYDLNDKMFVLDIKQLNDVYENSDVLGERYYIGTLSDKCFENNEYRFGVTQGGEWHTWLRTPYCTDMRAETVRHLWNNGNVERAHGYLSYIGVRPAFYIDIENIEFSQGDGSRDNPYVVE